MKPHEIPEDPAVDEWRIPSSSKVGTPGSAVLVPGSPASSIQQIAIVPEKRYSALTPLQESTRTGDFCSFKAGSEQRKPDILRVDSISASSSQSFRDMTGSPEAVQSGDVINDANFEGREFIQRSPVPSEASVSETRELSPLVDGKSVPRVEPTFTSGHDASNEEGTHEQVSKEHMNSFDEYDLFRVKAIGLYAKTHEYKGRRLSVVSAVSDLCDDSDDEEEIPTKAELDRQVMLESRSLFIFKSHYKYRKALIKIVEWKWFTRFIIFMIMANCICLALEDPLEDEDNPSEKAIVLKYLDYVFQSVFTIEAILKISAMGFALHRGAYLRDAWNVVDLVIVLIGGVTILTDLVDTGGNNGLEGLRTLRVLRPLRTARALRLVTGLDSLRILVNTIFKAFKLVANVLLLCFFFFYVFSIIAMQLFQGVLHTRCRVNGTEEEIAADVERIANMSPSAVDWDELLDQSKNPGFWVGPHPSDRPLCSLFGGGRDVCPDGLVCVEDMRFPNPSMLNFDHIGNGLLTVFQCSTMEGWTKIMYQIQDAHNNIIAAIFFIILSLFGGFLITNLALAGIKNKFGQATRATLREKIREAKRKRRRMEREGKVGKKGGKGHGKKNGEEQTHVEEEVLAEKSKNGLSVVVGEPAAGSKQKPKGCWGKFLLLMEKTAKARWFDYFFLSIVLLNTLAMAIEFHRMPTILIQILRIANYVFTTLFFIEFLVKILGLRPRGYFRDRLNLLDFVVVVASLVEVTLDIALSSGDTGLSTLRIIRVLRLFRVLRVTKVVRHMESMRTIINTIVQSIPSFAYIALLLVLLMFMYAVMGMQLFGGKFNFPYEEERRANFDTFLWSFVTVFQIITLEGWVQVMFDAIRVTSPAAALYFATLVLIGIYILLNLFLAVLLENESLNDTIKEQAEKRQKEKRMNEKPYVAIEGNILVEASHIPEFVDSNVEAQRLLSGMSKENALERPDTPGKEVNTPTPSTMKAGELTLNLKGKGKGSKSLIQSGNGSTTDTPRLEMKGAGESEVHCEEDSHRKQGNRREGSNSWALPGVPEESTLVAAQVKQTGELKSQEEGSRPDTNTSDSQDPALKTQPYDAQATMADQRDAGSLQGADPKRSTSKESSDSSASEEGAQVLEGHKHRSLFLFSPTNAFRLAIIRITMTKWFEQCMLAAVIISSLLLAVDTPALDVDAFTNVSNTWVFVPDHWYRLVLDIVDFFFTAVFSIELIFRIIALGLVAHKGSYWRDSWSILDTLIVLFSWLSVGDLADVSFLKTFRVMRALRPLRAIRRVKSMRLVVGALFRSVKSILNVMLVCLLVWLIFGILGVELMKGKFSACKIPNWNSTDWEQDGFWTRTSFTDDSGFVQSVQQHSTVEWANETCRGDECTCPTIDGVAYWKTHPFNFDNLGTAFMTLFVVATSEGWLEVMYAASDGWEEDRQPIKNSNEYLAFFFMLFMIIGSYMFLNLFSSTIFLHYHEAKERDSGLSELNKKQIRFVEMNRLAMKTKILRLPDVPRHLLRRFFFRFVEHGTFSAFIMICIVLNIILMSLSYYEESCEWKTVQEVSNFVFTMIFTFEFVFKLIAYGAKGYFREGWNRFDFFIVVGSAVDMGMTLGFNSTLSCTPADAAVDTSILRLFRIQRLLRVSRASRVLRLAQGLKGMNELFSVISAVLPSMYSNASVLGLLLFVYAVLGINLFYSVPLDGEIYRQANFRDIFMAFLTLLRCLTGEDWNELMTAAGVGNDIAAIIFFLSFVILGQLVMMNMVLAAVVDAFDAMSTGETSASAIITEEERRKQAKREVFERRKRKRLRRKKQNGLPAVDENGEEILTPEDEEEMERLAAKWEAFEDKHLVGPARRDDFRQYATLWSKLDPKGHGYIRLEDLPKVLDGPSGGARLFGLHPLEEIEWRAKGNHPRRGKECEEYEAYKGMAKASHKKSEIAPEEPDLLDRANRWLRLLHVPSHRRVVGPEGESESFVHFREVLFALVDFRWRIPLPPCELADELWAARIIGCPSLRPPTNPDGDIVVGGRLIKKGKKKGSRRTKTAKAKRSAATFDSYITSLKLNRAVQKLVVEEDEENPRKEFQQHSSSLKSGLATELSKPAKR